MDQPPVSDDFEVINLAISPDRVLGQYHAHGSATFPRSLADTLRFTSRGANCGGRFEVSLSEDPGADELVVDIDVLFRVEDALDDLLVCRLHPGQGEYGVGISTGDRPMAYDYTRSLNLRVHLCLPAPDGSADTPLRIRNLSTHMPLFSHHLYDLAGSVFFERVALSTVDAPIQVESLAGDNLSFVTVNGGIRGTLLVTESIVARTKNGPIALTAHLMNDQSGAQPTRMTLQTDNGPIQSNISLVSTSQNATGGDFSVTASTTNGPLTIAFQDAPVNSVLNASLQTCNAPARVAMHSTFEGRYELHGFAFLRPSVRVMHVQDPSGRRRRRDLATTSTGMGVVRGYVRWQPASGGGTGQAREGYVRVHTTNAPLDAAF
ncbi:hypothetical protein V8D89_001055 [Ganoderma adspersum]